MNKVFLLGRLTDDPRVSYGKTNQTPVARFSVAIDRGKNKNGDDLGTDYPNVVCFGKTAEIVDKYVGKGMKVAIDGHLHTDSYEKDGRKIYVTDVYCDRFEFAEPKRDTQQLSAAKEERAYTAGVNKVAADASDAGTDYDIPEGFKKLTDDDIPF